EKVSEMPYGKANGNTAAAFFGNMKIDANEFTIKIGNLTLPNTVEAIRALLEVYDTNNRVEKKEINGCEEVYRYNHPYMGMRVGLAHISWNSDITNPQKVCTMTEEANTYDFGRAMSFISHALLGTDY
ncbi:MAG: hypothetical protein ACRCX2_31795, partial [Paraclostridium sp.]